MTDLLKLIQEDATLPESVRRVFTPTKRGPCAPCNSEGVFWSADGVHAVRCTNCAGRGYIVTEAQS